jgi:hypothetical protein
MAEFSYEADIAPMRGSYFSGTSLSDAERKQLQAGYMEKVAPYQDVTNKTLERMLALQDQEINFQRQKIELEKSKEESRFLLDTNAKLGGLTASLGNILKDGSKDSFGKAEDITNLQLANAAEIARNPTYRMVFDAAATRLGIDDKRKILEDKKEEDRLQLMNSAATIGDSKLVKEMAGGLKGPQVDARVALAKGVKARDDRELESKTALEATKLLQKQSDDARQLDLQILSGYESSLRSMKPPTMTDAEVVASIKNGELPSAEKIGTKEFSEMDALELKEILMDLNPSLEKDPKRLDSVPAMELYRMAFRGLNRKRNRYRPEEKSTAGIGNKFNE